MLKINSSIKPTAVTEIILKGNLKYLIPVKQKNIINIANNSL